MMHLISLVAFPTFLLSILVLGIRGDLFSSAPGVIACQVCGFAVMVWARASFPRGSFSFGPSPTLLTIGKIVREERLLRATLPGYVQYARSTKALVPFVL